MKKILAMMIEWIRPAAIVIVYFIAEYFGKDPVSKFHILGPVRGRGCGDGDADILQSFRRQSHAVGD